MYKVSIIESSKELTAKERIMIKDTTDATKLDGATAENPVIIYPSFYALLKIENDKSDDKEYNQFIVVDEQTGEKFVTGSESFISSFYNISNEMQGEEEKWGIKAYREPSRNRAGQHFLTCSII